MVAEDDVQGPLFGRHVAAVMRRYFSEVHDIWAFRDLLLKDGYWELLDTPEGAATPNKRLTAKGRALGSTVPARLSVEDFHQELQAPIPGAYKTGNSPGKSAVTPGGAKDGKKVVRQARDNTFLLVALADHHEIEKVIGGLPTRLSDRVFQKHLPSNQTAGNTCRLKAKKQGWIDFQGKHKNTAWSDTPECLAHLEKEGVKPTLTPEEINTWLIEFGLRQPEPPAKPKVSEPEPKPITVIKVPYGQWLAYVTFRRLLEILVTDYNWPVADRLPIQLLHETLFSLEPATPHGLSSRLTKMRENGLVAFLGCVGQGSTVWRIKDVEAEPVNQRGARPKLTDANLQLVIGNILFRRQQMDRFHELITKRHLGRY